MSNLRPLPPVGATVIVHDPAHGAVECIVTESPMPDSVSIATAWSNAPDATRGRRLCVRGATDPTYRIGGVIHCDENVYGASITYTTKD